MSDVSVPPHGLTLDDLRGDPRRVRTERIVKWVLTAAATISILISAGIIWSLAKETWTFVTQVEWSTVLFSDGWFPRQGVYDIRTLLVGTPLGHGHRHGRGRPRRPGERHLPVRVRAARGCGASSSPPSRCWRASRAWSSGFFALSVIAPVDRAALHRAPASSASCRPGSRWGSCRSRSSRRCRRTPSAPCRWRSARRATAWAPRRSPPSPRSWCPPPCRASSPRSSSPCPAPSARRWSCSSPAGPPATSRSS